MNNQTIGVICIKGQREYNLINSKLSQETDGFVNIIQCNI